MSKFVQVHILTSYPPSNLNRDDLGRPKTAMFGGRNRLRVSSQCLKRTWRTSATFEAALAGHLGKRTRRIGELAMERMLELQVSEKKAGKWAASIAAQFGKVSGKGEGRKAVWTQQLVHVSPEEEQAVLTLSVFGMLSRFDARLLQRAEERLKAVAARLGG